MNKLTDYICWTTFLFYFMRCSFTYPYGSDSLFEEYKRAYYEPRQYEGSQDLSEPKLDTNWPTEEISFDLGQVGGLDVCEGGDVHVFHRGPRKWEYDTFDENNNYLKKEDGPLDESIEILQKSNGLCKKRLGKDKFYLPHGIALDGEGHYWLTDVATHQVYKLEIATDTILVTLGKQFEPAKDNADLERFCKPSGVAVAPNGDIFVSDGYCNNRIMKFSENGTYLGQIFDNEDLKLPHSVVLIVDEDLVCAASRSSQPSSIVCYTAGLTGEKMGEKITKIEAPSNNEAIFAITYSPKDKIMYAVSQFYSGGAIAYTITMEGDLSNPMHRWNNLNSRDFDQPHDIAVSPKGDVIYIGMISAGPRKIWKFNV